VTTGLVVAALGLTLLVVALLLVPLLRRRPPTPPRDAYDLAVYVAQLHEIDRDCQRGILGAEEAAAASSEIKRRMLALTDRPPAGRAAGDPPARRQPAAVVGLAFAVPALAVAVYLAAGSPASPDRPLASRQATGDLAGGDPSPAEARAALIETVGRLERFLGERPDEANGWLLLGRAYLTLDRPADAVSALQRALDLSQGRPDIAAAYAEALIIAAGGRVDGPAEAVLRQALAADPRNIQARFYLALSDAQRGDRRAALQGWIDVLALTPAEAPWRGEVENRIGEVAAALGIDWRVVPPSSAVQALLQDQPPGPGAADIEAAQALSPEDRARMIEGMVERLAARLRDHPDDRDGWLRLARAYEVLGQPDKAAQARARAAQARPAADGSASPP
jgi:cytochrome c-type biogenesis protein CcmH